MMKEKITVLIADDQEIYRDGLKTALSKSTQFEVVGEAKDGSELVLLYEKLRPDVVLADVKMPVMDGVAATKQIMQINLAASVIAISMYDEEAMIGDMIEVGALGYLVKNADKEEIYQAISHAYMKQPYYCKHTSAQLAKMITRKKKEMSVPVIQLNDKEVQIIVGICEEMNNHQIAKAMYMSKRTIDGYRSRILEKLNLKTSIGVVKYAIKTGIYKL